MTPWAHHLASRWMAAFRSPMSCFVGFGAAYLLTNAKPTFVPNDPVGAWVTVWMTLVTGGWFVAAAGAGRTSGAGVSGFPGGSTNVRDRPHPALPITSGVRALTEALAGCGVIVIWQALLFGGAARLSFPLLPFQPGLSVSGWLSGAAPTWCLVVPAAMAWLLPAQTQLVSWLRGLIVTTLAAAALETSSGSPPLALVLAAALVAALLATTRVAMIPGPITRTWRSSAPVVMFRGARGPLAQLSRDACFRPLSEGWPMFLVVAACFVLAAALVRMHVGPDVLAGGLTTMAVMTVGFLGCYPLGIYRFAAGHGGGPGVFNGQMGLAWSNLPLRRAWVIRAVYLHGMIAGLAFVALNVLSVKVTGQPTAFWMDVAGQPIDSIPLLCAVAPFAGFLTCRAAGDRVRGAVSLATVVAILVGLPLLDYPANGHVPLAVATVLAVAGGAPPLIHLFDRR